MFHYDKWNVTFSMVVISMEIFAETLEPLENQIKLCDNTSERFCAYV